MQKSHKIGKTVKYIVYLIQHYEYSNRGEIKSKTQISDLFYIELLIRSQSLGY